MARSERRPALSEDDFHPDPFEQFRSWFREAENAGIRLPEAMALATATRSGVPSARMVLLKGLDERGFVFYTHFESRKGRELADNPQAALVFYWGDLGRQVRVEGRVERIAAPESEEYFRTRPRGSRLAAWASPQSQVIERWSFLEASLQEVDARFAGEDVPLPPAWGGFRLAPDAVEFWQHGPDRLHDRLRYRPQRAGWKIERLAP